MTKRRQPRMPDCPTFRRMWMERASCLEMAQLFGVAFEDVGKYARIYGYPDRSSNRRVPKGEMTTREPQADPAHLSRFPAPDPDADMPAKTAQALATDRWPLDRVVAVFRTGGRYDGLSELARSWGVPVLAVVGLWHRVRVVA